MWPARQKVGFSPRAMMIEGRSSSGEMCQRSGKGREVFFEVRIKG